MSRACLDFVQAPSAVGELKTRSCVILFGYVPKSQRNVTVIVGIGEQMCYLFGIFYRFVYEYRVVEKVSSFSLVG